MKREDRFIGAAVKVVACLLSRKGSWERVCQVCEGLGVKVNVSPEELSKLAGAVMLAMCEEVLNAKQ